MTTKLGFCDWQPKTPLPPNGYNAHQWMHPKTPICVNWQEKLPPWSKSEAKRLGQYNYDTGKIT